MAPATSPSASAVEPIAQTLELLSPPVRSSTALPPATPPSPTPPTQPLKPVSSTAFPSLLTALPSASRSTEPHLASRLPTRTSTLSKPSTSFPTPSPSPSASRARPRTTSRASSIRTSSTPQPSQQIFNAAYFLQTDSNSNYAAANVHLAKTFHNGYQFDAIYTYSKSLDQISNGSGANSLANQTNPANNYTEWGPSDYDTRHRITVSGLWNIQGTRGDQKALNVLTNGWQINGIYTFHTGFPFTPVVANSASNPFVTNAATISPTRPYAYLGGFQSSCQNGFYLQGLDVKNTSFILAPPAGTPNRPGIGRNAFTGPCYTDIDLSAAREQKFHILDHTITARFQANFFNAFNSLNLTPFTNGNAGGAAQIVGADPSNPADAAARAASNYGKPTAADAGRQIEFFARIQF